MLLDSETAVKVAHDIIHDAREYLGHYDPNAHSWIPGKWIRLLGPESSEPSGLIEFEFADGSVSQIPCAWQAHIFDQGSTRPSLTLKGNGFTATWKPGSAPTIPRTIVGAISDSAIAPDTIVADSILGIKGDHTAPIILERPYFESIASLAVTIAYCAVNRITIENDAFIAGCTFESLMPSENGHIDASLSSLPGASINAQNLTCTGEQIVPILKMNAWTPIDRAPITDAAYTGYIPFAPLDSSASPINGFDNPLNSNPFFPDWVYTFNAAAPRTPKYAWMPSIQKPQSRPSWQDSDGIHWYLADISVNAYNFGATQLCYPPRYRKSGYDDPITPPMPESADGLIVSVQQLDNASISYAITDRYERIDSNTWRWIPGYTKLTSGPSIHQFILKRIFAVTENQITAVEYQFLPMGDL